MSFDLKLEQGDLRVGPDADVATVEGGEKLTQDIYKILTTEIGANRMFPAYGSPITQTMVGRAFDAVFFQSTASSQLRFSVTNLQRLQNEQLKSDQIVTAQEQIAAVQGVSVHQNEIDPRFFNINLTVISKAFRRVNASFSVTL